MASVQDQSFGERASAVDTLSVDQSAPESDRPPARSPLAFPAPGSPPINALLAARVDEAEARWVQGSLCRCVEGAGPLFPKRLQRPLPCLLSPITLAPEVL